MDHSKRRLLVALLSVTLLSVLIWQLGAAAIGWQRDALVARLSDRLHDRQDAVAISAVRALTSLDEATAVPLVSTALSQRPRVAPAARWSIDDMLARWHRECQQQADRVRLATRLAALADALAAHLPEQGGSELLWARELAQEILRVAGDVPAGERLSIVADCDGVLSRTDSLASTAADSSRQAGAGRPTSQSGEIPDSDSTAPSTRTRETAAVLDEPTQPPEEGQVRMRVVSAGEAPHSPRLESPSPNHRRIPRQPGRGDPSVDPPAKTTSEGPSNYHSGTNRSGNDAGGKPEPPAKHRMGDATGQNDETLHRLLQQLAVAPADEVPEFQDELAGRGLGRLPQEVARMMVSTSVEDRKKSIDALTGTPGVAPEPWLLILAKDPAPEVRLAVVTLLATSRDPQLVEKARQIALHDEDPRVGRIAEWLQNKRATMLR